MKNILHRFAALSCLVLFGLSNGVHAEQGSLKAMIPWDGKGRVFKVNTNTMLFLGAFQGIIYVETSAGKLNEGFVICPVNQKLNLKTRATSGSGHCMITVSGGDTVFAEWTCAGKVGACKGKFKLTNGSGQFEGISGSSTLEIRSPLRALVGEMASGSILHARAGLAVLPELKYRIPAKK